MGPRRWTFDHAVAVLEFACAVVVVVWLFAQGTAAEAAGTGGRTLLDRAFPFVVGLAIGAVLLRWSVRSWRAGNRAAARAPEPDVERDPDRVVPPQRRAEPARRPPSLSPEGESELARVVAVLAEAGIYAPHVPDPQDLRAPVADHGEPVTADGVLAAFHEAEYYVMGFDTAAYCANLAFHATQVEQFAEDVQRHVADLVRLAGGGLADVSATVELVEREDTGRVRTTVRLTGGIDRTLRYDGAWKYLSTVVHVALARTLRERGTGRRLASLGSDQGIWLTGLPDGAVERLNAALGPAAGEGWEWVDEQEPVAAGEMYPSPPPR